jgi:hypothetical protein
MRALTLKLSGVALLCAIPSAFAATESFPLPCDATLQIDTPPGLTGEVHDHPDYPLHIVFSANAPDAYGVMLEPACASGPQAKAATPDEMRAQLTALFAAVKDDTVEQEPVLKPFRGAELDGLYFSVSDRTPSIVDFNFMSQGVVNADGVRITFTVKSNGERSRVEPPLLEMVRTIRIVRASPAGAAQ